MNTDQAQTTEAPQPLAYKGPSVRQGSTFGSTVRKHLKLILIGMWAITGLGVAVVGGAVWLMRDRPSATVVARSMSEVQSASEPLPVLFDTPKFSLTNQDGQAFDDAKLRGHVWVADFIFTHCASFCPVMTNAMYQFQQRSAQAGLADVRMASFTVDPDRDTPPVLKGYAHTNGADESRWSFLTGPQKAMWDVSMGMKLSVGPGDTSLGGSAGMQVMHSSHFLLVDRAGHVRGVYDFKDAAYLDKLVADAKMLSAE
jgi:protein SCO1/2